jgi:hypothetical protein
MTFLSRRGITALALLTAAFTLTSCTSSPEPPSADTSGAGLAAGETPRPVVKMKLKGSDVAYITAVDGGIHSEHALNPSDGATIRDIRSRFEALAEQLRSADLTGFRTAGVRGLEPLVAGSFTVTYHEIGAGASIRFAATDPAVVDALHALFSAQRARAPKPAPVPSPDPGAPLPAPELTPTPEATGSPSPLPTDGGM